ncbi:ABC transporter substrate-binding protein [Paenibacillus sp. J22TS3]|uniref:ABC transporter substrate-binding protein n=1 Tax=Paenibacillus sp. J22TS3 TaxID=2807192 RepID=UPI001B1FF258|nr:ABC transporter substrate-binding protein [Paenibacillus sp. J22TS3]GIP21898.1 diguanylate phosphodiesterase [Paenibacillus sp. J22TS3]
MKKINRIFSFMMISVLLIGVLSACSSSKNEAEGSPSSAVTGKGTGDAGKAAEAAKGGSIVVIVPQDPDYLDPHLAVAAGTSEMMFNVYEGLLKPNEKGEVYPAIAESYEISKDGLTYTFKLRQGVKFHNGNPLTAQDVKYSYDRLAGKDTGKPLQPAFAGIDSITTPDDHTVVIKLKENNASFLTSLIAAVIPKNYQDSNKKPIGTGPFKFVEYVPGQRLVLEKNPDYYVKDVPKLDKVEFRIIPDQEAALLALKSGEADIFPRIGTEKLDELGDDFKSVSAPQNLVQLMTFNIARKPFNNLKVRQAINYAIDKDEIINGVALGKGTKLGSNMSPIMSKYYEAGLEDTYKTNLDKAKSLLAEAGYKDGFSTTLTVPSNYKFHVDTAQVIVQQLAKVGIKVKIVPVEWAVWLSQVYQGRDYDMTIIGLDGKLDPNDILNKYVSDSKNNFFNFSDPAYDKVLKEGLKEIDPEKRAALYKEAQKILTNDAAAVYIMDPNLNVALKKNIEGYKQYPLYVQDISTLYLSK